MAKLGSGRSFLVALAIGACNDADLGYEAPTFSGYLQGSAIVLEKRSPLPLAWQSCSDAFTLRKRSDGDWVPLRDDRHPSASNPGYYIDGTYVPPSHNLGCDVISCVPFEDTYEVGLAEEYVMTGSMAPPAGAEAERDMVDVIETRTFHGELRVDVEYFAQGNCAGDAQRTALGLTVPVDGVCCPIGRADCSTEGPGGGWAPDLDSCAPWSVVYDAYFRAETDSHGCAVLVEDTSMCCGCLANGAGI